MLIRVLEADSIEQTHDFCQTRLACHPYFVAFELRHDLLHPLQLRKPLQLDAKVVILLNSFVTSEVDLVQVRRLQLYYFLSHSRLRFGNARHTCLRSSYWSLCAGCTCFRREGRLSWSEWWRTRRLCCRLCLSASSCRASLSSPSGHFASQLHSPPPASLLCSASGISALGGSVSTPSSG